ncbi:MAG: ABC transporter substrate-binding protein [Inquilinus sp.]|nr:ABC transporter substrate-binding protein [Inquilinus sp.]
MTKSGLTTATALAGLAMLAAGFGPAPAQAQDCTYKIGSVLSLTGSYGAFGVPISKAAQLAVEQVDEARGDIGCALVYDVRDSQTQASVAVDSARKLIDLEGVTALVGPISSGITAPLLTSVTLEEDVLVIATASTSSTFTNMGRSGETKGLFFRTLPADSLQAVATAKMAWDAGFRNPAVIYLNNDWGVNNQAEFVAAFEALGGTVADSVAYNADQASYRSEVNKALEGGPDAVYLLSTPQDGRKIFREWVRFEGPSGYILAQGMNDEAFTGDLTDDLLANAWFITPGTPEPSSVDRMERDMQARWEISAAGPGRASGYDAGALIALAHVAAAIDGAGHDGPTLAQYVRELTGPEGEPFFADLDGYRKAIAALQEGRKTRYIGPTGPVQFDAYGDVAVPFIGQQFRNGEYENLMQISLDDVRAIKAEVSGGN